MLPNDFLKELNSSDPYLALMQQEGQIYRQVKRRKTIKFTLNNKTYFAKLFSGISVKEILKNLIKGRLPVADASHEYKALERLSQLGVNVPKVIAYDTQGINPLTRKSFIVMEALEPSISLEDYLHQWDKKPLAIRRALIRRVAEMVRILHTNGIQHRDLYICHFLLRLPHGESALTPDNIDLSLIDLHRARFKSPLPDSWLIKDLAALYFSVLSSSFAKRDYYRFLRLYTQRPLRETLHSPLWGKIKNKAIRLYKKTYSAFPQSLESQTPISGDFLVQESFFKRLIIRKDALTPELMTLLGDPESIFSRAEATIMKESPLCTLARTQIAGKELVIKQYRWKNGWQGFTRLFRPSRAARCWRYSNLLLEHGILTPKPIALVEKRWGIVRRDSYLITEYCYGPLLRNFIATQAKPADLQRLQKNWEDIQQRLIDARLSHGDANVQNFLVTDKGLVMLDLDTMRWHFLTSHLACRAKKDHERFTREWGKYVGAGKSGMY